MAILVTGAAGFIGFHLAERLLARGETVIGLDNLNDYYEVGLKEARLARLQARAGFAFHRLDLADRAGWSACLAMSRSTGWCIWPRRPECAIPSPIRMPMPRAT